MYQEQVRLAVSPTPCLSRLAHGPAATVNTIRLLDEDKPPTVLEQVGDGDAAYDLKLLTLEDRPRSEPLLETPSDERNAELSPDGRWLAYESDLSGQMQIYVSSFPNVRDGKGQISSSGGRTPLWAKSGRELFFVNGTSLMAVEVQLTPTFATRKVLMVKAAGSASESGRPADLVVVQNLVRALELVATYLGLLKKQVEHSGEIDLVARLRAARQRGRAA